MHFHDWLNLITVELEAPSEGPYGPLPTDAEVTELMKRYPDVPA